MNLILKTVLLISTLLLSNAWSDPVPDNTIPLRGILTRNNGHYFLNHQIPLEFASAHPVNGFAFNQRSQDSFLNSAVALRVIAPLQSGQNYQVQSIVAESSIRVSPTPVHAEEYSRAHLFENRYTQSRISYQETLFSRGSYQAQPGDQALIITLSGRQGEDMMAAAGHFAVGSGSVHTDDQGLWLESELFNIYVANEKGINPGITPWTQYFGHITGGQNNYRPTWTLVIYGVQPQKIQQLRDSLQPYFERFSRGDLELTLNYNCTTISVEALAKIGIYGVHRRERNGRGEFRLLPTVPEIPAQLVRKRDYVEYVASHELAEFLPRNAWQSVLDNLQWLRSHEGLNIDRIDLVFQPQVRSARPIGGASANDLMDFTRMFAHPHDTMPEIIRNLRISID